jgi:Zn-dependent oligopeptidase
LDRKFNVENKLMIGNLNNINIFLKNIKNKYFCEDYNLFYQFKLINNESNNKLNKYFQIYFTINSIIKGLFIFFEMFFQLKIIEVDELHEDYKLFYTNENIKKWKIQIFNVYNNNKRIGTFYLDLYSRNNKLDYPHILPYNADNIFLSYPVASVCMSFENEFSKITLYNLKSLFHEFGHVFHLIFLGNNAFKELPQDFIEIPSTLFENFIQSKDILKLLTNNPNEINDDFINLIKINIKKSKFIFNLVQYKKAVINYQLYTEPEYKLKNIIMQNSYFLSDIQSFNYKMDAYKYLYAKEKSDELYNKFFTGNELNPDYGKKFKDNFLSKTDMDTLNIYNNFISSF